MNEELYPQEILETEEPEAPEDDAPLSRKELAELLTAEGKKNADLVASALGRRVEAGRPLQQDNIIPDINISLEGLPDPAVHGAAAFHAEYMKRVNESAKQFGTRITDMAAQKATQAANDAKAVGKVENLIREALPNVRQQAVDFAANQIATQLQQQGLNPMAELRSRPDEIAQDIIDYIGDMGATGKARRQRDPEPLDRGAGLVSPRTNLKPRRPGGREPADNDRPDPNSLHRLITGEQQRGRIY